MTTKSARIRSLPLINLSAFAQALFAPVFLWGGAVLLSTLGKEPGIVYMTPIAWLLSIWSGVQYIRLSSGYPGRAPLLGGALLGILLGLFMGRLSWLVSSLYMPAIPSEVGKTIAMDAGILIGGMLICAGLSTLFTWTTLKRYSRT